MLAKVSILEKIFILITGIFPLIIFSQTYRSYIKHSDIKTDLEYLETILQYHPSPIFQNNISEYYTYMKNSIYTNIPESLEIREFRNLIKEILHKTHCGHTEVALPSYFLKKFKRSRLYQIPFMAVASDSFALIFGLHKSILNKLHFGDTILTINGEKINNILLNGQKYFTHDGYIENSSWFNAKRLLYILIPIHFDFPKKYELLRLKKGKVDTIHMEAIKSILPVTYKNFTIKDTLIKLRKRSSVYYYIPENDSSWSYIKISNFVSNKFNRCLKKAFRYTSNRENLILDLRGNPGGRVMQAEKLYYSLFPTDTIRYMFYRNHKKSMPYSYIRHALIYKILQIGLRFYFKRNFKNDTVYYIRRNIKKIKNKNHFRKIYVLTNYGTFSAASFVVYRLSQHANCKIIGTETGGTASGCNSVLLYPCQLPKSKLKILMPAFRFCHSIKEFDDKGHGVFPHHWVENKPEYYFLKKDSVLNFTIQQIQKSKMTR